MYHCILSGPRIQSFAMQSFIPQTLFGHLLYSRCFAMFVFKTRVAVKKSAIYKSIHFFDILFPLNLIQYPIYYVLKPQLHYQTSTPRPASYREPALTTPYIFLFQTYRMMLILVWFLIPHDVNSLSLRLCP